MSSGERYLLVITKNKSSVVLECQDHFSMKNLQSDAEFNGALCRRILIEDFYPDYRGFFLSKFFQIALSRVSDGVRWIPAPF